MHLGLVGCGRWGKLILRDLKQLGCRVCVVANSQDSIDNATRGGADSIVAQIAQLPQVDAAVVAASTIHHAQIIESLLPRGVPVFCEKPLTCDIASAERIVENAGERVFVMDKWRYHAGVIELARIARAGELGPVLGLKTLRVGWGNPHQDVNIAWILLPHDLSIAIEVLGALPEPRWAQAEVADGRLLGMHGALTGAFWHQFEVGARSPEHRRRVELVCRDGVAVLAEAYADGVLIAHNPPAGAATLDSTWEHRRIMQTLPLHAELAAFVAHLNGGPPPRSSAADGLAGVRAIARLHELAGIATDLH